MKKVYIEPEMKEVKLHTEGVLLVGTIQSEGDTPKFKIEGSLETDTEDDGEEAW